MDIKDYQREVIRTMPTQYDRNETLSMLSLGLAGEAGEVIELIKKNLYHGHLLSRKEVEKELGDVMWYIANLATRLDLSMENILEKNIEKLKIRYPKQFSYEDSLNRVDTK